MILILGFNFWNMSQILINIFELLLFSQLLFKKIVHDKGDELGVV